MQQHMYHDAGDKVLLLHIIVLPFPDADIKKVLADVKLFLQLPILIMCAAQNKIICESTKHVRIESLQHYTNKAH